MVSLAFPICRHAEPMSEAVRQCHAPQLAGLLLVGPETCASCVYRDHPAGERHSTPRPLACIDRGPRMVETTAEPSENEVRHACLHAAHEAATVEACANCLDYQYPVLSPRMPETMLRRIFTAPPRRQPDGWWTWPNVIAGQRQLAREAIDAIPEPPPWEGRGVLVVGGGNYQVSAYVTVRVLRHVGCRLPIQVWQFDDEGDPRYDELFAHADAELVRVSAAAAYDADRPFRFLNHRWRGWQLKAFALVHCAFREVLLLDADCYPVRDPECVFEWRDYRERGAVFWPDPLNVADNAARSRLAVFEVEDDHSLWTESGQLLVDKRLCWRELNLALHYNSQADFTYHHVYGDKDTFPIAWRRLGRKNARMWPTCRCSSHGVLQLDERGQVLFQHRFHDKFRFDGERFEATYQAFPSNRFNAEMEHEAFCFQVLDELRAWLPCRRGGEDCPNRDRNWGRP